MIAFFENIFYNFFFSFLGYIITRFRWMIRLIAIEAYSFALFFFLLDLYSQVKAKRCFIFFLIFFVCQPSKFLPLGIGTIGSVTMTLFVFFIYPYLHRW